MLGFQGGVSIPLVKGGVKAPPAKRQCRAGPKAGARRGFTREISGRLEDDSPLATDPRDDGRPVFVIMAPTGLALLPATTRAAPQRFLPTLLRLALVASGMI